MVITSRNILDATKLTYQIQYCEGKAKRLIEDCVMMTPKYLVNCLDNSEQIVINECNMKCNIWINVIKDEGDMTKTILEVRR